MCRFPYLGVQLRDDMRDGHDVLASIARVASRRGLEAEAIAPHGTLARFAEGMDALVTFRVGHCACDWGPAQYATLAALTRDLLGATDVRRVRVGLWSIRGPVDRADPHAPFEIRSIDADGLDEIAWSSDTVLEVRRAAHPPFPTRPLRKLALG